LTASLFAAGSDTVVQSVSATEQTNRKGVYRAAYTDAPASTYRIIGFVGTVPVSAWWVDLTLTTATFQTYEVPVSVFAGGGGGGGTDWTADERTAIRAILRIPTSGTTPTDPTVGILDAIRDKTQLITAGTVYLNNPVSTRGLIERPLFIATDYKDANGAAFIWNIASIPGFVVGGVGGAVCYLSFQKDTTTLKLTGSVTDNGNGTWKLTIDMLASQTYLLPVGYYRWWVDVAYQGVLINKVYQDKPVEFRNDPNGPIFGP